MPTRRYNSARSARRRGSILVTAAVFLVVAVGFLAFALDLGNIVSTESELQNAADAGAMSAALSLSQGRATATTAAKSWATKNLIAAEDPDAIIDEDIEFGRWNDDQASFTVLPLNSSQSPNAVRVTCRRTAARGNPLVLFFAPLLGSNHANVTATATARMKQSRCGLIIGLSKVSMSGSSYTDSYRSSDGAYNPQAAGSQGHVCSNGNINMSGSSAIYGNGHPGKGKQVNSSSSIGVVGNTDPLETSLSFPPANPGNASTVNNNDSIPLSDNGIQPLRSSGEFKLSGGDGVSLPAGTYYFNKMNLSGGSTVRIQGPTKIFVEGDCSLSGGSVANVTTLPKNLKLFPMGSNCTISGDSAFFGAVYAPNAKVERSGSSDFYGSIIAGELVLSGSGGIHADLSLDDQSSDGGLRSVILVQ